MTKNYQVYNVCGYGSTGSSAVVNLLEEYSTCKHVPGEFRFIQDPDGLMDLCFNLSQHWGWNRSDAYIRRFIKYTDIIGRRIGPFKYGEHLNKYFNYNFFKHRDEFVRNVIDTSWHGHWFFHDFNERNFFQTFIENGKRSLSWHFGWSREWLRKATKKSQMHFVRSDKDIYKLSEKFLISLFDEINLSSEDRLIFDQLGLAYHFDKYKKIIPGLRQIVVERDPRDVYLDAKNYNAYPITNNVSDFVNFYEGSRAKDYPKSNNNCLVIRFEDLIFQYDQTTFRIEKFVNLEKHQHVDQFKKFDPQVSIKNTRTWRRPENKKFINDIREIENKLNNWCYNFE